MNLDRVTVTGADDSIGRPENLLDLTREFPFVEWGILVHAKGAGEPRFPSDNWISDLQRLVKGGHKMPLSLHVCGRWVRDLLIGNMTIPESLLFGFDRVQLNFHAENTSVDPPRFYEAMHQLRRGRQFIFQIDGNKGNAHLESLMLEDATEGNLDLVPLFDISGGAGVLPSAWPVPDSAGDEVDYRYYGYAGGLGPENLAEQIPLIGKAAGETRIWIDMETRVRSEDDEQFDLAKVRQCLEIAKPFVRQGEPSM